MGGYIVQYIIYIIMLIPVYALAFFIGLLLTLVHTA